MKTKINSIFLVLLIMACSLTTVQANYTGTQGKPGSGTPGGSSGSVVVNMGQGLRFYVTDKYGNMVSGVFDLTSRSTAVGGGTVTDPAEQCVILYDHTKNGGADLGYTRLALYDELLTNTISVPVPTTNNGNTYTGHGNAIKTAFMNENSAGTQNIINRVVNLYDENGNMFLNVPGATTAIKDAEGNWIPENSNNLPSKIIAKEGYILHIETLLWAKVNGHTTTLNTDWVYGTVTNIGEYCIDKGYGNVYDLADSSPLGVHTFSLTMPVALTYESGKTIATVSQPNDIRPSIMGNIGTGQALHIWETSDWDVATPITSSTYINSEYRTSSTTALNNPVKEPDVSPHPVSESVYVSTTGTTNYTEDEAKEAYYTDGDENEDPLIDKTVTKLYFSNTNDPTYLESEQYNTAGAENSYGQELFQFSNINQLSLDKAFVRTGVSDSLIIETEEDTGYTLMAYIVTRIVYFV